MGDRGFRPAQAMVGREQALGKGMYVLQARILRSQTRARSCIAKRNGGRNKRSRLFSEFRGDLYESGKTNIASKEEAVVGKYTVLR